jgi:large subunit ribosomal protein L17
MRHRNHSFRCNRTVSHRRCMIANMVKSLIEHERITTTVTKAKEIRRQADQMITLAKLGTLSARRRAVADLMIRFNKLDPKEQRAAKAGDTSAFNGDRLVIQKLFGTLKERFAGRQGGYTRIIRTENRVGDNAEMCILEFLTA